MCVLATEAAILAMFGLLFCLPACGSDSCICFASRFPQRLQLLWRAARYTHTRTHTDTPIWSWVQLILVAYRLEDREREFPQAHFAKLPDCISSWYQTVLRANDICKRQRQRQLCPAQWATLGCLVYNYPLPCALHCKGTGIKSAQNYNNSINWRMTANANCRYDINKHWMTITCRVTTCRIRYAVRKCRNWNAIES